MANWKTYGQITIAASIAASGALWFNSDNNIVHGDDMAECLSAMVEKKYAFQIGAGESLSGVVTQSTFTLSSNVRKTIDGITTNLQSAGTIYWMDNTFSPDWSYFQLWTGNTGLTNTSFVASGITERTFFDNDKTSVATFVQTTDSRTMGSGNTNLYYNGGFNSEPNQNIPMAFVRSDSISDMTVAVDTFGGFNNWWDRINGKEYPAYIFEHAQFLASPTPRISRYIKTSSLDSIYNVCSNLTRTICIWQSGNIDGITGEAGTLIESTFSNTNGSSSLVNTGDYSTVYNHGAFWTEAQDWMDTPANRTETAITFDDPFMANWLDGRMDYDEAGSQLITDPLPDGTSSVSMDGDISFNTFEDLSMPYPSDYAISNGLVSKIRNYVMIAPSIPDNYIGPSLGPGSSNLVITIADNPRINQYVGTWFGVTPGNAGYTNLTLTTSATVIERVSTAGIEKPYIALVAESNGTTRPTFDLGVGAEAAYIPFAQETEWSEISGGRNVRAHNIFNNGNLKIIAYISIAEWSWEHLNPDSPFVP